MALHRTKQKIKEMQHDSKGEEQKELSLKKQYDLFTKEAEELDSQLEQALDKGGRKDGKIEEALLLFKVRKE